MSREASLIISLKYGNKKPKGQRSYTDNQHDYDPLYIDFSNTKFRAATSVISNGIRFSMYNGCPC